MSRGTISGVFWLVVSGCAISIAHLFEWPNEGVRDNVLSRALAGFVACLFSWIVSLVIFFVLWWAYPAETEKIFRDFVALFG